MNFDAPENMFVAVGMTKRPCSIPKLLPYLVYGAIHYGSDKPETLINSVMNNIVVPNFTGYTHVSGVPQPIEVHLPQTNDVKRPIIQNPVWWTYYRFAGSICTPYWLSVACRHLAMSCSILANCGKSQSNIFIGLCRHVCSWWKCLLLVIVRFTIGHTTFHWFLKCTSGFTPSCPHFR